MLRISTGQAFDMRGSMLAFMVYGYLVCILLLDCCHAVSADMTKRGASEFSHGKMARRSVNCGTFGGISDGCSTPAWSNRYIPHVYNDVVFTEACNRHDICYVCSALIGKTKQDCDRRFRENMLANCGHSRAREGCQNWANVYYLAVAWKGVDAYADAQLKGHGSSWRACRQLATNPTQCW